MRKKKYKSKALEALHGSLEALHDIHVIDKQTMRDFDDKCLVLVDDTTLTQIKQT